MRKIIEKATDIYLEYQGERIKEGLDYNIFSMLDIERHEMKTHEYMIYAIMNLSQDRGLPVSFSSLFLENMGLPKKFTKCEWSVEREYDINGGRIDLFLKSKGKEKLCVAVEMKIDADDQECQLKRYDEYCRRYSDYRVIYLILDGKEATEKSVVGIEGKRKIVNVSFGEHIVQWLGDCIEACNRDNIDSSFVKQYEILVKKITKEDAMENKVKELIKGSENVKACLAIAEALESVKDDIINEFFERLYILLQKRCKALYWDDECVICQIRKIKVRGEEILICMQVGPMSRFSTS